MGKALNDCTKDELIQIINSLKSVKKYGLVWEDKPEQVALDCTNKLPVIKEVKQKAIISSNGPTNLIIEGDNYHALSVLNYTHAGKIDVIYIDPPYNTGAKDWKYNNDFVDDKDVYRHSKWISFMEKRLRLAKPLLSRDGMLITTIDDNELANLYLLIEEIFPECTNTIITIQMNPGGTQSKSFSVTNEYAIVTCFKDTKVSRKRHLGGETYNLRRWGSTSNRYEGATCFYPVILDKDDEIIDFGDVLPDELHPSSQVEIQKDGTKYIWPLDIHNNEKKWRYARDTVESVKGRMFIEKKDGRIEILLRRETEPPKTVWTDNEYNSESYGTKLLKKIIGKGKFTYPKSLYATKDCIALAVQDKPSATILDFFAGSGTTGHAVLELNKEDNGARKFILCTNNENNICEEVTYERIKTIITGKRSDGSKYDEAIPSNVRYFKTSFLQKDATIDKLRRKLSIACEDMIRIREGAFEIVINDDLLKVYKSEKSFTAIIYDRFDLEEHLYRIDELETDEPINLYVFSYSNADRSDEIPIGLKNHYISQPIPEGILEIYKKIFKEGGMRHEIG